MMLRVFFLLSLTFFSTMGFTQSTRYQVDIIVFTHAYTPNDQKESSTPSIITHSNGAIPLRPYNSEGSTSYRLLSTASSSLQGAWSRLNQHSQYQPLFHYTWIQPSHNQHPIRINTTTGNGWNVEGTLRVRQSNYYLLDTELRFSEANHHQSSFIFAQKQRLKPGNTYYLDHPQAGMLINVHRVG